MAIPIYKVLPYFVMDKNAVAKFCSQGLVDLCIRSLKPVDCLLHLPRVLEACAWSAVHEHINGRF